MFIFGRITVEFPEFPRNHLATYYIGRCQEEMEMRELAMENYNKVLTKYPASQNTVDLAKMGLMRINYREGFGGEVRSLENDLSRSVVADSISHQASYYLGEQELRDGNPARAKQYFSEVPRGHKYYMFAQHSLSVAEAQNDNFEASKTHLDNVIQTPYYTQTETYLGERIRTLQESIKNRSFALLGYYYFNNGQYPQAVASLREVEENSRYYIDALIGLAWSAFKVQNWSDCRQYSTELLQATDNPVLRAEASVILAYYHMMNNSWNEAVEVLAPVSKTLENYSPPSEADLEDKEEEYYDSRAEYFELANEANQLVFTTYSSYVENQKSELESKRDDIEESVRSYQKALDKIDRAEFFGRDKRTIEQLVNYTLGRASEQSTVDESEVEELRELESEEQELLRQLEQLEQME
jgi:DNA repair exonuclease SbcCD ATPase subunit